MKKQGSLTWLTILMLCVIILTHQTHVFASPAPMAVTQYADDQISYQTCGEKNSEKGVVFFLHGLGDNKTTHQKYIDTLAKAGFYVIAPDAYSHGNAPGSGSTIIENVIMAKDMIDAMIEREQLVEENIYLYGYSMGGMTAYYYAANGKYPVKGIVSLISTPDFSSVKGNPLFYESYREKEKIGDEVIHTIDTMLDAANPLEKLSALNLPIYMDNGTNDPYMSIDGVRNAVMKLQNIVSLEREAAHTIGEQEFMNGIYWLSSLAQTNTLVKNTND